MYPSNPKRDAASVGLGPIGGAVIGVGESGRTPAGKSPQSCKAFWDRAVGSGGSHFLLAHPPGRNAMCDFTEAERQGLTDTRSLARDEEGREVLVGLTAQAFRPADGVSQTVHVGKQR